MAKKPNTTIVFELKGKSLEAAKRLEQEIIKEHQAFAPKTSGYLNEIRDSWQELYSRVTGRLSAENPDLLARTGLAAPTVQVNQGKDTLPRAYRKFPEIYLSPEKEPRYFMYVPTDYKGDHFTPEDGVRLTGKKEQMADSLLFAGGWLGNAPLVGLDREGVALPRDFRPETKKNLARKFNRGTHTVRCFVAGGESLDAIADFDARQEKYATACASVSRAIEKAAEQKFPEMLASLPVGEELRANVSYRYGGYLEGKTEFLLAVRMEGKTNLWNAGKTVSPPENPFFLLGDGEGGDRAVLPRTDTPEGQMLAELMKSVPPTPSLADYPALLGNFDFRQDQIDAALGINGARPQVWKLDALTILVYNAEDGDKTTFCPPGATPLPAEIYYWLRSDQEDKNMGVKPPPMPATVADFLKDAKSGRQGPENKPPSPAGP